MQDVLRDTQDHDLGPAISHFFNCFLGQIILVGTKGSANNMQMRDTKKVWQNVNVFILHLNISAAN